MIADLINGPSPAKTVRPVEDLYKEVGANLRRVRAVRGLPLIEVQQETGGRLKAAALASYERGDRRVPLDILLTAAEFYDVPITALLPDSEGGAMVPLDAIISQLEALRGGAA